LSPFVVEKSLFDPCQNGMSCQPPVMVVPMLGPADGLRMRVVKVVSRYVLSRRAASSPLNPALLLVAAYCVRRTESAVALACLAFGAVQALSSRLIAQRVGMIKDVLFIARPHLV